MPKIGGTDFRAAIAGSMIDLSPSTQGAATSGTGNRKRSSSPLPVLPALQDAARLRE
ncbi:MAG TPA: hypothetical protein VN260_02075 [Dissulfurispiraceae bacterium]|nr:hypothetical protein [Dissulfurispiraceae bacterium]